MDWSRAKSIILVILIILNIFLFINVFNEKSNFEISMGYRDNAKQALEEAGFTINCPIPINNKPVPRISFTEEDQNGYTGMIRKLIGSENESESKAPNNYYYGNGKILELRNNSFILTDETQNETFPVDYKKRLDIKLKSWIRKNKVSTEPFVLDSISKEGDTVTVEYVQVYKNIPVFNNKIVFTIENSYLKKVKGSLRIFSDIQTSKKDEIISSEITLLTGKGKINGIIDSIDLGYLQLQQEDIYDTPVWRVKLASGEQVWFNAFTGEWIKKG